MAAFGQFVGGGEVHAVTGLGGGTGQPDGQHGLPDAGSEGDRLQQLRAVLPCEVRVVAQTHPLFGRLLSAQSFKRWNGVLLLVVELPDSPGTIRAMRRMCSVSWSRAAVGAGRRRAAGAAPAGGAACAACRMAVGRGSASRFASSLIALTTTGEVNPRAPY